MSALPSAVAAKAASVREQCADPALIEAIASTLGGSGGGSAQMLQKIVQRNRYKHRGALHFKALGKASQCLRDAHRFFGGDLLSRISKDCQQAQDHDQAAAAGGGGGGQEEEEEEEEGCCRDVESTASNLHRLFALMDSLCAFTHAVYPAVRALEQELSRGAFMGENVTVYALLAEIAHTIKATVLPRMESIFNSFLQIASDCISREEHKQQRALIEFEVGGARTSGESCRIPIDPGRLFSRLKPVVLSIDGFWAELKPSDDVSCDQRATTQQQQQQHEEEDIGEVVVMRTAADKGNDYDDDSLPQLESEEEQRKAAKSKAHSPPSPPPPPRLTEQERAKMSSWLDDVGIDLGNQGGKDKEEVEPLAERLDDAHHKQGVAKEDSDSKCNAVDTGSRMQRHDTETPPSSSSSPPSPNRDAAKGADRPNVAAIQQQIESSIRRRKTTKKEKRTPSKEYAQLEEWLKSSDDDQEQDANDGGSSLTKGVKKTNTKRMKMDHIFSQLFGK